MPTDETTRIYEMVRALLTLGQDAVPFLRGGYYDPACPGCNDGTTDHGAAQVRAGLMDEAYFPTLQGQRLLDEAAARKGAGSR